MRLQQLLLRDIAREHISLPLYITEENIRRKRMITEELYVRLEEASFLSYGENGIYFRDSGVATFDTYQNSFSTGKWKKYTIVEDVFLQLEFSGSFEISLMHSVIQNNQVVEREITKTTVSSQEREMVQLDFGQLEEEGIFYPKITALEAGSRLYSGYYGTKDLEPTQNVKLAIAVCTFRREKYVERNMEILKREILENPESPCYGNMWVHISDNGCSLDGIVDTQEHITVNKNANLGGVGGFTRGIIETQKRVKEQGFTHVLLMDDDATISTSSLEVNYILLSYLKQEYFGYTIGGKLLVLNVPFMQFEVGAQWNAGSIVALKNNRDIRLVKDVMESEIEEEKIEYQGWWYSCIPLQEIDEDNLPLPIFIHRDDVEYGIRTGQERFLFLLRISLCKKERASDSVPTLSISPISTASLPYTTVPTSVASSPTLSICSRKASADIFEFRPTKLVMRS